MGWEIGGVRVLRGLGVVVVFEREDLDGSLLTWRGYERFGDLPAWHFFRELLYRLRLLETNQSKFLGASSVIAHAREY